MKVRILYFGILKDLLGSNGASRESEVLELSAGLSVAQLISMLRERAPQRDLQTSCVWDSLAVAVNRTYASADVVLHEGDEVALLPPVSGGY